MTLPSGSDRGTRPDSDGPPPDPDKRRMFEEFADVIKVFGSPVRLMLLDLLGQAERSVESLAAAAGASIGNTSAQLQLLADAGMVVRRRDGNRMLYRSADPEVGALVTRLMAAADHRSAAARDAAARYLGDLDGVRSITATELEKGVADGSIVLLDVRPGIEFRAGHIDGARHVDVGHLSQDLRDLLPLLRDRPESTRIVAYCRGPYCAYAPEALRLLEAAGVSGRLLPEGLAGWRASGRPVSAAEPPVSPADPAR